MQNAKQGNFQNFLLATWSIVFVDGTPSDSEVHRHCLSILCWKIFFLVNRAQSSSSETELENGQVL